jgi:hypothetical protein
MPLKSNSGKSFQGSIVLGKGFILTPEEALSLIDKDPRNKEVLFPYLNGDDLNNSPIQEPSRWVINFFDWSEEKARTYPDCFEIVERLVKPERLIQKDKGGKEKWWQFLRPRKELYATISELDQVMVVAQVSKTVAFAFTQPNKILDAKLNVFVNDSFLMFAFLQSNFHIYWAWKYSSTMKADLSYAPTQVFETFPFPKEISSEVRDKVIEIGKNYYNIRASIMSKYKIGLTKFYNIYHAKGIQDVMDEKDKQLSLFKRHMIKVGINVQTKELLEDIGEFRKIAVKLDKIIIDAYEWTEIGLDHSFYDLEYLPENDRTRFSIRPDARREILKRLLLLNHQIYSDETSNSSKSKPKSNKKVNKNKENSPKLF